MEIIQLYMKFQEAVIYALQPAPLMKRATCSGCLIISRKGSKDNSLFTSTFLMSTIHLILS